MRNSTTDIETGQVKFSVESALLEELGERLVAKPEIAITELIKNAHDADANKCNVLWGDDRLVISDDGCGMTLDAFKNKWMKIATSNKRNTPFTEKYGRSVTGAKGVGRFSVRFLGSYLVLETTAYYKEEDTYKTLKATFDWKQLSKISDLDSLVIDYEISKSSNRQSGTVLTISNLKQQVIDVDEKEIKTELLKVISPFSALKPSGRFGALFNHNNNSVTDPGFEVNLAGEGESLAEQVLNNYVARTILSIQDGRIIVNVIFADRNVEDGLYKSTKTSVYENIIDYQNTIGSNVYIDIRYFPHRAGVFLGKDYNGKEARNWISDNFGVAIYDRNFRIKPYGEKDDDWLGVDRDSTVSARDWDTQLMKDLFGKFASDPSSNPMLYLPSNRQLVGAVFLESTKTFESDQVLIPSMDRMGFINNTGFRQLREAVRFAVELIAYHDRRLATEFAAGQAKLRTQEASEDIKEVIKEIETAPHLSVIDKTRIIKHYVALQDNLEEIDDYHRKARSNIDGMSLLGAVAGFMTHEYQSMLFQLKKTLTLIEGLAKGNAELADIAEKIKESIEYFEGYISYTSFFINNIGQPSESIRPFNILSRVEYVLETFSRFRNERNVTVEYDDIDENLTGPKVPVALYDGIIHNLYSNALKSVITVSGARIIRIQVLNDKKSHIIRIMDTGTGIPPKVRKRIWDPMFTTTSNANNPLGSGLGLGLSLVKSVVESMRGKIALEDFAPKGFATSFKVILPL